MHSHIVCNHGGLAEGNVYFSNDLYSMPCDTETVGAEIYHMNEPEDCPLQPEDTRVSEQV